VAEVLEAIEMETGRNPDASVIWMHGLGADGNDFAPIVPALQLPNTAIRFGVPGRKTGKRLPPTETRTTPRGSRFRQTVMPSKPTLLSGVAIRRIRMRSAFFRSAVRATITGQRAPGATITTRATSWLLLTDRGATTVNA